MPKTRPNQSDKYQYKFNEIPTNFQEYEFYSGGALESVLQASLDQEFLELRDRLLEKVLEAAPRILTERQYQQFHMYFVEHKPTTTIGRELGINTATVQHTLFGNSVKKRQTPGAIGRLQRHLMQDQEVKTILSQIQELSQ